MSGAQTETHVESRPRVPKCPVLTDSILEVILRFQVLADSVLRSDRLEVVSLRVILERRNYNYLQRVKELRRSELKQIF